MTEGLGEATHAVLDGFRPNAPAPDVLKVRPISPYLAPNLVPYVTNPLSILPHTT